MPKVSTSDFRNGLTILLNGEIYSITEFLHVKPGKGGAFVRSKLKGVVNGKVLDKTFRAGESVEAVRVERRPYQFLYKDGDVYYFMHKETFDQIPIPEEKLDRFEYLKESQDVQVVVRAENEEILFAEIPDQVVMEVTETEPGVKGDTAQGATKPATLESGVTIQVPLFINQGDKVKVNTKEGSYLERVKN
ncbi:elongation factor P [Balneolaceae bacterium ANBcel3]|nr:elongation factor P [Balneolaceae bacterium ANBcel3]